MPSSFEASQHPGIAHHFSSRLVAFEHAGGEKSKESNVLIWIGGLGDGLLTVQYPNVLARTLPSSWSLVQPVLSSSYNGWGTSSLLRDAKELGRCVEYFKGLRPQAKVVLMGHSTGSQDCMEYVVGPEAATRPAVQGIILQAGISDREGLQGAMSDAQYGESCRIAQQWVDEGRGQDVLPLSVTTKVFGAPSSAERWLSLASPNHDGPDDYFSSDLPDEQLRKTFGQLPPDCPLLVLLGGSDPYMPSHVDRKALAQRWADMVKAGGGTVDEENGGVVEGASHNLMGDPAPVVQDLVDRVCRYLKKVESGGWSSGAHL